MLEGFEYLVDDNRTREIPLHVAFKEKGETVDNQSDHGNLPDFEMYTLSPDEFTPAVKAELRSTIKTKLMVKGQEIPTVEYRQPLLEQLTPEEEEKRKRRRENNRQAAQRCRQKKKDLLDTLQKKTQNLECQNTDLRRQIRSLEKEKEAAEKLLSEHLNVCKYHVTHEA